MPTLRLVHSNPRPDDSLGQLDPDVRALLEHIRVIPPLPRSVRERALARARALIGAPRCPRCGRHPLDGTYVT